MDHEQVQGDKVKRFALGFLLFGLFILALGAGLFYFSVFSNGNDDIKIIAVATPATDIALSGSSEAIVGVIPDKVNLNMATVDELVALPGVGDVTAAKIIAARPYKRVDELLGRKVVNKSVYSKIQDKVTVGE